MASHSVGNSASARRVLGLILVVAAPALRGFAGIIASWASAFAAVSVLAVFCGTVGAGLALMSLRFARRADTARPYDRAPVI
jgi:hypothetical protein